MIKYQKAIKIINKISLNQEKTKSVLDFLEMLEEDDDVQNIYTNAEFIK